MNKNTIYICGKKKNPVNSSHKKAITAMKYISRNKDHSIMTETQFLSERHMAPTSKPFNDRNRN